MTDFEEEYLDVLQNIEAAIVGVYREQPALLDYEVENALNALLREYQAEQQERRLGPIALKPLPQVIHARVRSMCEWRLGRQSPFIQAAGEAGPLPDPLSLAEIVACLKRIRKSVQTWSKHEGRQGYVRFISEFIV